MKVPRDFASQLEALFIVLQVSVYAGTTSYSNLQVKDEPEPLASEVGSCVTKSYEQEHLASGKRYEYLSPKSK